jgi:hypothetical protein
MKETWIKIDLDKNERTIFFCNMPENFWYMKDRNIDKIKKRKHETCDMSECSGSRENVILKGIHLYGEEV